MPASAGALTRAAIIRPALMLVREAGRDPTKLIRAFHLSANAETARDVLIHLDTVRAVLDAAARELNDPILGVRLSRCITLGTYGVVDYISRASCDLRQLLEGICRYIPLINEVAVTTLTIRDGVATLRHQVPGDPLALGRHGNECVLALTLNMLRTLPARAVEPRRAWLAHAEPPTRRQLENVLEITRIEYGAGFNGVAFPAALLDVPIKTADPTLYGILREHAERQLAARDDDSRFLGQCRHVIRDELGVRKPTLSAVAGLLGLGPRSLQRQLRDSGWSFQALADDVCREVACERLRSSRVSVGDVAFALHYADESSFVRAFKRWAGMTPGAWRVRRA